jgi:hypothetical protein
MRAPEIEILANHGFEEVATVDRALEDLREADFQLGQGHAMIEPCGPIRGTQGPRESMRPAIEKGLDLARAERVTRRLQGDRIRT